MSNIDVGTVYVFKSYVASKISGNEKPTFLLACEKKKIFISKIKCKFWILSIKK